MAVLGLQGDAARGRLDALDAGTVENGAAAFLQARQQPVGHAVGVDARGLVAQDRNGCVDAITGLHGIAFQQFDLETMAKAKLELFAQDAGMPALAGVVKAVHPAEINVAQVARLFLQQDDGFRTLPVCQYRIGLAIFPGQVDHVGIDFILQQRRAGGRTPPAHVALLDNGHVMAVARELIGDQGAGDASTHHRHFASQILLQRREGVHQSVLDGPVGVATLQVHAFDAQWKGAKHASGPISSA